MKRIALSEACRQLGIKRNTVWMRIDRGMSPSQAIKLSVRSYGGASCG